MEVFSPTKPCLTRTDLLEEVWGMDHSPPTARSTTSSCGAQAV